jgi:hypothetical protein
VKSLSSLLAVLAFAVPAFCLGRWWPEAPPPAPEPEPAWRVTAFPGESGRVFIDADDVYHSQVLKDGVLLREVLVYPRKPSPTHRVPAPADHEQPTDAEPQPAAREELDLGRGGTHDGLRRARADHAGPSGLYLPCTCHR